MTRTKNLFPVLMVFLSICGSQTFAQGDQSLNIFGYKFLDYQENFLPEALLSGRSAVFVSVIPKTNGTRGNWEALSVRAHDYMKKIGIDPVAYLHTEDVFSGEETNRIFANWLEGRKIENLIYLSERMVNGKKEFLIVITPFAGKKELANHGQAAWKYQDQDLERLFLILYRLTASKSLKKENYLIVDKPEFFTDIPMPNGKRFESYQPDLKLDKLAVPLFRKFAIPEPFPNDPLNREIAREVVSYNSRVENYNSHLEQLMAKYPFSYGFVDLSEKTPEQLRTEGYQFMLYHIKTTGKNIKNLLDYRIDHTETAYVSLLANNNSTSIKPIPADLPVFKFYIRHILTNDVFLGSKWDADTDWGQALTNHFTGMKIELNIRQ